MIAELKNELDDLCDSLLSEKLNCLKNTLILYKYGQFTYDKKVIVHYLNIFLDYYDEIDRLLIISRKYSYYLEDNNNFEIEPKLLKKIRKIFDISLEIIFSYNSTKTYLSYALDSYERNKLESDLLSQKFENIYSKQELENDLNIIKK